MEHKVKLNKKMVGNYDTNAYDCPCGIGVIAHNLKEARELHEMYRQNQFNLEPTTNKTTV